MIRDESPATSDGEHAATTTTDAARAAPGPTAAATTPTPTRGGFREWLRRLPAWLIFQESKREGWKNVLRRRRYQRQILDTPPLRTATGGPIEVRVLTWRRDWINMIWALKSFYYYAGVDYPLFIHDGGLSPGQHQKLQAHFPDARLIGLAEADNRVRACLDKLPRSLEYRLSNPSTRKLFDFFAFSTADYVISIDSDIVFFRRPDMLLVPTEGLAKNRYNKDSAFWYSMTVEELEEAFGVRPPARINSGLSVVRRSSINFTAIERWLENPKLFADKWVTEQTLHALSATVHGVEFLPDSYFVATEPGLPADVVCKHYPGFFRSLLYTEGMARLIADGFLQGFASLAAKSTPTEPG
jgi:hypothetical protein